MSEPESSAKPQFSEDRQWWWNGANWIPAVEAPQGVDDPTAAAVPTATETEASNDEPPAFVTGNNGLTVSLGGEWWWNGSRWNGFDKKPAEPQPRAKGPKLGFKEAMATVGLAKQYLLSPDGYPMNPLGKKEAAQLALAMIPGEKVLSQCVGMKGQSLVVTDKKVMIIKTGWMAGSSFGAKATTFDFRTITSVEVRTGPITGAFSLSAGGVSQKDRTYWGQQGNDAYKSPDAIPIAKAQAPEFQRAAALIRELAARSLGSQQQAAPVAPDPLDQLKKLAELRDAGVLTAAEFDAKKADLLSRM